MEPNYAQLVEPQRRQRDFDSALANFQKSIPSDLSGYMPSFMAIVLGPEKSAVAAKVQRDAEPAMRRANALAKATRKFSRRLRPSEISDQVMKDNPEFGDTAFVKGMYPGVNLSDGDPFLKANLDVGTLTNFAQITGGQSLGYVSLDTQIARGTIRPNSFTLYQCLPKSAAFQVVDYWAYASDTGAGLAGTAFTAFANVSTGTLNTSAGVYALENITLKLGVNGRSITTALAAQNSFVDISAQENINAALAVLESVNWVNYYGNPAIYTNQYTGLGISIPSGNIYDFQTFSNNNSAQGWSNSQALFNMIYEVSATIAGYLNFGRTTHAFMTPVTMGALQSLTTTLLNNIVNNLTPTQLRGTGIIVDGDLQGMRTRTGEIQFPIDISISARYKPAQAMVQGNGVNFATLTAPSPPSGVTAVASGGFVSPDWTTQYAASSGIYSYAIAGVDASSNESVLRYVNGGVASGIAVSGVTATTGGYVLSITPPVAADAVAFRIYRSGLGYNPASSGVANPAAFRHIGTVAASGASVVTFNDLNTNIPGSENIYLLDLSEEDNALDFRFLLPLTKISLFAQNLYMPWAVAMIGAIRNRVPKFHAIITNFVPDGVAFNPLSQNSNAS